MATLKAMWTEKVGQREEVHYYFFSNFYTNRLGATLFFVPNGSFMKQYIPQNERNNESLYSWIIILLEVFIGNGHLMFESSQTSSSLAHGDWDRLPNEVTKYKNYKLWQTTRKGPQSLGG
jgi:hypothetical protein